MKGRSRVLARMATSGIYLLRGLPRDLQRSARARALREGTTLRSVLLRGLGEYAAGTWTPKVEEPLVDSTLRRDGSPPGLESEAHAP